MLSADCAGSSKDAVVLSPELGCGVLAMQLLLSQPSSCEQPLTHTPGSNLNKLSVFARPDLSEKQFRPTFNLI